jgi:polyphenol oxidase
VASKAARALIAATGCRRSEVVAVIGPHISGERFEVGEEVVDALIAAGLDADTFVVKRAPKPYVDLRRAVTRQLEALSVSVEHVFGCTIDDPRFFSHRRGGPKAGRMAGVIVWRR